MKEIIIYDETKECDIDSGYGIEDALEEVDTDPSKIIVVHGVFQKWNGSKEVGHVFTNGLKDAIMHTVMDYSTKRIKLDETGNLVLDEWHHDAPVNGNHYKFKVLTKRGVAWHNKHKDELLSWHEANDLTCWPGLSRRVTKEELGLV